MKKIELLLITLFFAMGVSGQDETLMTINGESIPASEFMYIYSKNNQEKSIDPKSMDDYLELFINFKLKVAEAEALGLDTTAAFKKELRGYRAQATPKYLCDNEALDSLVRMSYHRMANPRRAAHIALECPMGNDSLEKAVYAQMETIRQRVTTGLPVTVGKGKKAKTVCTPEDFLTVAKEVSTDPSVVDNGGELGWITPFRYVYVFEDIVYNTPIGEVTPIFRSPYGFHIALVLSEDKYEEVHAAHIMKTIPRNDSMLAEAAKAQMDDLYLALQRGEDFEELAKKESDDKGSSRRGGDLGWFGRGAMVQPFEDAVFALEEGNISEPFRSRFGWHIAKLYDRRGMQPIDSVYSTIMKNVQRDERMTFADKSFIEKTRAEYNLPADMTDEAVRSYADAHLEEKYEELRYLVNEYHDGILLFEVSLQKVWDKASKDDAGLTKFFRKNKKNYTWDAPRYKGYMIYAKNQSVANQVKSIIKNAHPDSIQSYINNRINNDSTTLVRVERGLWKEGQNTAVDAIVFKNDTVNFTADEALPFVATMGKVIKAPQEYADERGKVTNDYQDALEKEWIESLRTKYDWHVNQEVFDALKAKYE